MEVQWETSLDMRSNFTNNFDGNEETRLTKFASETTLDMDVGISCVIKQ